MTWMDVYHNRAFGILVYALENISLACVRNNWTGANHHSLSHISSYFLHFCFEEKK